MADINIAINQIYSHFNFSEKAPPLKDVIAKMRFYQKMLSPKCASTKIVPSQQNTLPSKSAISKKWSIKICFYQNWAFTKICRYQYFISMKMRVLQYYTSIKMYLHQMHKTS